MARRLFLSALLNHFPSSRRYQHVVDDFRLKWFEISLHEIHFTKGSSFWSGDSSGSGLDPFHRTTSAMTETVKSLFKLKTLPLKKTFCFARKHGELAFKKLSFRILVRAISYTVHGLIPASCVFADRYNREEVVRSLGKEVNINPPLTLGQLPDTPEELLKLDQVRIFCWEISNSVCSECVIESFIKN